MFQLYNTMKNIWGFLPLLEEKRRLGLLRWKNIYGQGCKVGRKNFCLKLEMRLWSRLSFNPFLLTRWVFLKCWFVCVRKLKQWFVSFGRAKVIKKRSIGWSGSHCVHQNRLVESVLEISKNLIMLYWPNRCGDWFTKKILCFTRFLVRNTSLVGVLWNLLFLKSVLMLGGVFYRLGRSLRSVLFEEWAVGKGLTCGSTDGS